MTQKISPHPIPTKLKRAFGDNQPPASLRPILLQRALVWGETEADYDALFRALNAEIAPSSCLEWLHLKHLVDLTWEIHRYRRLKVDMINLARVEATTALLTPILSIGVDSLEAYGIPGRARKIAEALERGSDKEYEQAVKILSAHGLSLDDVTTQAMILSLPNIERLDRLIASAEARVVLLIRDVARLKDAFATRFQETADTIQDGTFEEVTPMRLEAHG